MREIEKLRKQVLDSIPTIKHKLFNDNLFMIYSDEIWMEDSFHYKPNRIKVSFDELDRPNLMCILSNHNPLWRDLTQKKLDIKHLKNIGIL